MGIKGLESYIRENRNLQIAQKVNIRDEITDWRRKHGSSKRPKIIINLKHFTKVLANIDDESLIIGGQYALYNKLFENFFKVLHSDCGVDLVFFCQTFFNNIDVESILRAYDCIQKGGGIKDYLNIQAKRGNLFPWHVDKRFLFNLMQICPKYGEVHVEVKQCSRKIVEYARKYSDEVLAMIQYDTKFLIFDHIQYQYWNLADLDISQLTTMVYRHDILYNKLDLTPPQCRLLSAIQRLKGNTFLNWVQTCQTRYGLPCTKLFKIAGYVQRQRISNANECDFAKIAHDIYGNNHRKANEAQEKIKDELDRDVRPIRDETVDCNHISRQLITFCKENLYFVYGLLVEYVSSNQALAYIDLRQPNSKPYIDAMNILLLKMIGILFKDVNTEERPKTRKFEINRRENEISIVDYYPPMVLPTLEQIILEETNDEFKASRWSLFAWLLGLRSETVSAINELSQASAKYIRLVNFTLKFLLENHLIDRHEANIIFATESADMTDGNDVVLDWPDIEPGWIQTAHKYTIAFEMVCHCLEICGLRCETDLIKFNALKFHANMVEAKVESSKWDAILSKLQGLYID